MSKSYKIHLGKKYEQNNLSIYDCEIIHDLKEQSSFIWKVKSWDKGSVENKLKTSYVELPNIIHMKELMKFSPEAFKEAFTKLLEGSSGDNAYIGKISYGGRKEKEEYFLATIPEEDELKEIADKIKKSEFRRSDSKNKEIASSTNLEK